MDKVTERKNVVTLFAETQGWDLFEYQKESFCLRFTKDGFTINVWLSKMTVAIVYNGKQYFIRKVSEIKMEEIFNDPLKFI